MFVNRPITPQNHPFPFLLQVEWGLLAIARLSDLLVGNLPPLFPTPVSHPCPKPRSPNCLPSLALEREGCASLPCLALVTLATERRLHLFLVLYVVLVIRSCLMFRLPGRLLVTVAALGMFAKLTLLRFHLHDFVPSPDTRERIRPLLRAVTFNSILSLALALGFISLGFILGVAE